MEQIDPEIDYMSDRIIGFNIFIDKNEVFLTLKNLHYYLKGCVLCNVTMSSVATLHLVTTLLCDQQSLCAGYCLVSHTVT